MWVLGGWLVWSGGRILAQEPGLATAGWVDRAAAASLERDSLFPFEKSQGKGDGMPGTCGGCVTDVGTGLGLGLRVSPGWPGQKMLSALDVTSRPF